MLQAEKIELNIVDSKEETYEWKKNSTNRMSETQNWESSKSFIDRNWNNLHLTSQLRLTSHYLRKYSKTASEKKRQIFLLKIMSSFPGPEGIIASILLPFTFLFSCPAKTYIRIAKIFKL